MEELTPGDDESGGDSLELCERAEGNIAAAAALGTYSEMNAGLTRPLLVVSANQRGNWPRK